MTPPKKKKKKIFWALNCTAFKPEKNKKMLLEYENETFGWKLETIDSILTTQRDQRHQIQYEFVLTRDE